MAPAPQLITQLQQRFDSLSLDSVTRPSVVVSSCLLGQPVRYDGGHKSLGHLNKLLSDHLELHSVCPEVAANMGTPRPPIQWIETSAGGLQLQQVDDPLTRFDHSLEHTCRQQLAHLPHLDGAILKARSPSCGSSTTPIFSEQGQTLRNGDGVWAATLKAHRPDVLVIDEEQLQTDEDAYWFIAVLYAHKRMREQHIRESSDGARNTQPETDILALLYCSKAQRPQFIGELLLPYSHK